MKKSLNNYVTIEGTIALLLIFSYFMPWVDMALLVKVVGWDIPFVQSAMQELSKKTLPEDQSLALFAIYVLPLLAIIGLVCSLIKIKIARVLLAICSILGLATTVAVYYTIPNLGSGLYMLSTLSILTIAYLIYNRVSK